MARVALVTGGSRGIGAAISVALKAAGYKVAANYAGNDEAAAAFTKETGIPTYKWSVADYDACAAGVAKVEADLGPVDILVAIELVAQTAALLEGWKRLQSRRGGVTGWLVGIKSAAFRRPRVAVPATLITTASRSYALEGYAVFSGTVSSGAEVLADVQIQAFRPEDAG